MQGLYGGFSAPEKSTETGLRFTQGTVAVAVPHCQCGGGGTSEEAQARAAAPMLPTPHWPCQFQQPQHPWAPASAGSNGWGKQGDQTTSRRGKTWCCGCRLVTRGNSFCFLISQAGARCFPCDRTMPSTFPYMGKSGMQPNNLPIRGY